MDGQVIANAAANVHGRSGVGDTSTTGQRRRTARCGSAWSRSASRERELAVAAAAAQPQRPSRVVEELLEDVDRLIERARTRGRLGKYRGGRATEQTIEVRGTTCRLRAESSTDGWNPTNNHWSWLADRFERLLVRAVVLEEIAPYIGETLTPLVGERAAESVRGALRQRPDAALEALRAQFTARPRAPASKSGAGILRHEDLVPDALR